MLEHSYALHETLACSFTFTLKAGDNFYFYFFNTPWAYHCFRHVVKTLKICCLNKMTAGMNEFKVKIWHSKRLNIFANVKHPIAGSVRTWPLSLGSILLQGSSHDKNKSSAWEKLFLCNLEYKIHDDYSFVSKGFAVFRLWDVKDSHVGLMNFLRNHPMFSQPSGWQRTLWLTGFQMNNSNEKAHSNVLHFLMMITNGKDDTRYMDVVTNTQS